MLWFIAIPVYDAHIWIWTRTLIRDWGYGYAPMRIKDTDTDTAVLMFSLEHFGISEIIIVSIPLYYFYFEK